MGKLYFPHTPIPFSNIRNAYGSVVTNCFHLSHWPFTQLPKKPLMKTYKNSYYEMKILNHACACTKYVVRTFMHFDPIYRLGYVFYECMDFYQASPLSVRAHALICEVIRCCNCWV